MNFYLSMTRNNKIKATQTTYNFKKAQNVKTENVATDEPLSESEMQLMCAFMWRARQQR